MRKSRWIKILASFGIVFLIIFVVIPPFTRKWYQNHLIRYAPPISPSKWKKFSSAEGKFSVWFPGIPETTNTPLTALWSNLEQSAEEHLFYVNPNIQNSFVVAYCDNPMFSNMAKLSDPQKFLKVSQSLVISNEEGKVVFEQESKFGSYPAREYEYVAGGKANYSVRIKCILVGVRIYQIYVIFLTGNPYPEERKIFFNSFSLN